MTVEQASNDAWIRDVIAKLEKPPAEPGPCPLLYHVFDDRGAVQVDPLTEESLATGAASPPSKSRAVEKTPSASNNGQATQSPQPTPTASRSRSDNVEESQPDAIEPAETLTEKPKPKAKPGAIDSSESASQESHGKRKAPKSAKKPKSNGKRNEKW